MDAEKPLEVEGIARPTDGAAQKYAMGYFVPALRMTHEPAIACAGPWSEVVECRSHPFWIGQQIKPGAIGKETAPLGIERHQIEIIREFASRFAENAVECARLRE